MRISARSPQSTTLNATLVVMGAKLGLHRALAAAGGLSSPELAELRAPSSATFANGSTPRSQAARSSTPLRAAGTRFDPSGPSPARDPGSPVYLPGFQMALGLRARFSQDR